MNCSDLRRYIWVTAEFEAFHRWDKAPEQVAFLRNLHRHIFKVRANFKVTHSDRDLEFFMVKKMLNDYISNFLVPLSRGEQGMSCEMFAEKIFIFFKSNSYPVVEVSVSEDGENGAIVVG